MRNTTKRFIQGGEANTIYIDPSYGSNGAGTITDPKNTFVGLTLQSNYTYRLKRNTTYNSSTRIKLLSLTNTVIKDYGAEYEPRPIFNYSGTGYYAFQMHLCTSCMISNWEITGPSSTGMIAGIGFGSDTGGFQCGPNNIINNCKVHQIGADNGGAMGIRAGGSYLKILNNEIFNISVDGIFIADASNLEIGWCNVHHVNKYYSYNTGDTPSSGDGIQLDGIWDNYHIHHTTIDRSDGSTGNKFCLIISSLNTKNLTSKGIVEYCTFKTRSTVPGSIYISNGNGNVIRYNKFEGTEFGVRISGAVDSSNIVQNNTIFNTLIHHNQFYNSDYGIIFSSQPVVDTRNTMVYNNVFYNIDYHILIQGNNQYVDARNNLHLKGLSGKALDNITGGSSYFSNNFYDNSSLISTRGAGLNAFIGDPKLVNASTYDFRLTADSSCINNGTDVSLSIYKDYYFNTIPQREIPSIGIDEYVDLLPPIF